jgi:BolA family transcriptional regulator, general stress-responsive regulator
MPDASTVERMRARLTTALAPLQLDIEDESAAHAGHAGAQSGGGHYRVRIVSEAFTGLTRVARHRLVYDALQDLMQRDVHALALSLVTPNESGRHRS